MTRRTFEKTDRGEDLHDYPSLDDFFKKADWRAGQHLPRRIRERYWSQFGHKPKGKGATVSRNPIILYGSRARI